MKIFKNVPKRLLAMLGVVGLLSILLSSCLKDHNKNYTPPPVALLSVIQASPDAPPADFFLNNNRVNGFRPLVFGDYIDYFQAFTGTRIATFYMQGTSNKIFSDTIQLNANSTYSLFLANKVSNAEAVLVKDSISRPAAGNANIRFINLSPDAPAVDLAIKGGAVLVANKAFKGYSEFQGIPGNIKNTFEIRQTGTNTVLATLTDVTLSSGSVYTIWFRGLAGATDNTKLSASIITNAFYY